MSRPSKAYIAGAFEHPTRKAVDKTVPQLHAEVALGALQGEGWRTGAHDTTTCLNMPASM